MVLSGPVEPWSSGETELGRTNDVRPETYEADGEWIAVLDFEGVESVDDEGEDATYRRMNGVLEAGRVDESGEQEHVLEAE